LCLLLGAADLWVLNGLVLPQVYGATRPLSRVKVARAAEEPRPNAVLPTLPAPAAEPLRAPEPAVVVQFELGSHHIPRAGVRALAAAYEHLGGAARISVVGHADASGPDEFNERLSKVRAESVATKLTELGIDGTRIELGWYGERRPREAGDDKRVEIYLGDAP
jgi:outer membrane protein OmpA-like peptidoglycan-associated protein